MKIIVENAIPHNYEEIWTNNRQYRRYTATHWKEPDFKGRYDSIIEDPEYIAELESAYQDYIERESMSKESK